VSEAGRWPPQGQVRGRRCLGGHERRRRKGHCQTERTASRRELPEEEERIEPAAADLRAGHRGRPAAALHRGGGAGRLLAAVHPRQGLPRLQTARLPAGLSAGQYFLFLIARAPSFGLVRQVTPSFNSPLAPRDQNSRNFD
jgi:hypothetical protein